MAKHPRETVSQNRFMCAGAFAGPLTLMLILSGESALSVPNQMKRTQISWNSIHNDSGK